MRKLTRNNAFLDEEDALGAATHEKSIKEDVPHGSKVFGVGAEFILEFIVNSSNFILALEQKESTGSSHDFGGDLLVLGVNTFSQFSDNFRNVFFQLGLNFF